MNTVWSGLGTPALTIPVGLSSKGVAAGHATDSKAWNG